MLTTSGFAEMVSEIISRSVWRGLVLVKSFVKEAEACGAADAPG